MASGYNSRKLGGLAMEKNNYNKIIDDLHREGRMIYFLSMGMTITQLIVLIFFSWKAWGEISWLTEAWIISLMGLAIYCIWDIHTKWKSMNKTYIEIRNEVNQ